jgi:hypothetical protein
MFDTQYLALNKLLELEQKHLQLPIIPIDARNLRGQTNSTPHAIYFVYNDIGTADSKQGELSLRLRGEIVTAAGHYARVGEIPGVAIVTNNGVKKPANTIGFVHKATVRSTIWLDNFSGKQITQEFPFTRTPRGKTGSTTGNWLAKLFAAYYRPAFKKAEDFVLSYDFNDERAKLAGYFTTDLRLKKELAANNLKRAQKAYSQLLGKLGDHVEKIDALQAEHARILDEEANKKLTMERGFRVLNSLWGNAIHSLEIRNNKIFFMTAPIVSEGVLLGRYKIVIPLDGQEIGITPETDKYSVNGYCHPHIYQGSDICWGQAGVIIETMRSRGQHLEAIPVILEYLRTYHHDHQYVRIELFAKKQNKKATTDSGKRWRECHAKVEDPYECVGCVAPECRYKPSAVAKCYKTREEKQDFRKCVTCSGCSMEIRVAAEDKCYKTHAGKDCPTCPNTHCKHGILVIPKPKRAPRKKAKPVEPKQGPETTTPLEVE